MPFKIETAAPAGGRPADADVVGSSNTTGTSESDILDTQEEAAGFELKAVAGPRGDPMSATDGKVLLCRLYERVSARGNRYLAGRFGAARIIGFIDDRAELQYGATACFNLYVQAGDDAKQDAQASVGGSSRHTGIQRWRSPEPESKPADDQPRDDPIDDMGR
jgi:hypothetical protein